MLSKLKKYSTKQIYHALKPYADPEYAVLAAWYVNHDRPLKQNVSFFYGPIDNEITIDRKTIDIILDNYQKRRFAWL